MRKKELISENRFISEELQKLKNDNSVLKEEILEKSSQIEHLSQKIDELKDALLKKEISDKKVAAEVEEESADAETEENIMDYGAVIIGKVIVSAAEYCGRIESDDQERIDAAIGDIYERTENVKSEILSIISSDNSYDKKSRLMEREYQSAVSFFDRTVARV